MRKKVTKLMALFVCLTLLFSMSVFAADSPSTDNVGGADSPSTDDISGYIENSADGIEDEGFYNYLLEISDTNGDGKLSYAEAEAVITISYIGKGLTSIKGIEFFKNVKTAYLQFNELMDISYLKELTSLENLDIRDNNIENIDVLSGLTKLIGLWMSDNNITDISGLASCTELQRLYIDNNDISDISDISLLTKLKYLSLEGNNVTDFSSLASLTNIVYLNLSGNNITDISGLMLATTIGSIDLSNNQIVDIESLADYSLYSLDVSCNKIKNLDCLKDSVVVEAMVENEGGSCRRVNYADFALSVSYNFSGNPITMSNAEENLPEVLLSKLVSYYYYAENKLDINSIETPGETWLEAMGFSESYPEVDENPDDSTETETTTEAEIETTTESEATTEAETDSEETTEETTEAEPETEAPTVEISQRPATESASGVSANNKVIINGVEAELKVVVGTVSNDTASLAETAAKELVGEGSSVLKVFNLTLPEGDYSAGVQVTMNVPGIVAGQKVAVLHQTNGGYGEWEVVPVNEVGNGYVTATFTSFSPVAIVSAASAPSTGYEGIPVAMVILALSLLGAAYCVRRKLITE